MTKAECDALCRALADKGKLIEAGFIGFQFAVIPSDASPLQLEEMRMAFFAGAQHLFGSIMQILEPETEPSENDLKRMDSINTELNEFIEHFKTEHAISIGNA